MQISKSATIRPSELQDLLWQFATAGKCSFKLTFTLCPPLQVLVWAAPEAHLGALEATLRQLTAATLPQGATRAIYVVDAYRCPALCDRATDAWERSAACWKGT